MTTKRSTTLVQSAARENSGTSHFSLDLSDAECRRAVADAIKQIRKSQQARPTLEARFRQWKRRLEELAEFKTKHGHCCVPMLCDEYGTLARWVTGQRRQRRRGQLSQEQIRLLDELGFSWITPPAALRPKETPTGSRQRKSKWETKYATLAAFQRVHQQFPERELLGSGHQIFDSLAERFEGN